MVSFGHNRFTMLVRMALHCIYHHGSRHQFTDISFTIVHQSDIIMLLLTSESTTNFLLCVTETTTIKYNTESMRIYITNWNKTVLVNYKRCKNKRFYWWQKERNVFINHNALRLPSCSLMNKWTYCVCICACQKQKSMALHVHRACECVRQSAHSHSESVVAFRVVCFDFVV